MRNVAIMPIEGVLSTSDDIRDSFSNDWARPLYESLRTKFRTILFTSAEEDLAKGWLEREFISDYGLLELHVPYLPYASWRVDRIRHFLSEGFEVGVVLDTDPGVIYECSQLGVMGMLVTHPALRRGWKQHVSEVRPWGEVVGTVRSKPKE